MYTICNRVINNKFKYRKRKEDNKTNVFMLSSAFGIQRSINIVKRFNDLFHSRRYTFTITAKEKYEKENNSFCTSIKTKINRAKSVKVSKEEILCFNRRKLSCYIGRYEQIKRNDYYNKKVSVVIQLQKYIRGYLGRKLLHDIINANILYEATLSVIYIQKCFRRYYIRKKTRENIIIMNILLQRKLLYKRIERSLSKYFYNIIMRKYRIYNTICSFRMSKILTIQHRYKVHYLSKLSRAILSYEKYHYVLTYPFKCKTVQLKLYRSTSLCSLEQSDVLTSDDDYEVYSFEMCPLRKIFVLYINKGKLMPGIYKCQFIVDNCIVCDGRFPHKQFDNGMFYNVIRLNNKIHYG